MTPPSPTQACQLLGLALYWLVTIFTTLRPELVRRIARHHSTDFVGDESGLTALHKFADWYSLLLATPVAATSLALTSVVAAADSRSPWVAAATMGAYALVMLMWGAVAALGPTSLVGKVGKMGIRASFGLVAAGVETAAVAVSMAFL